MQNRACLFFCPRLPLLSKRILNIPTEFMPRLLFVPSCPPSQQQHPLYTYVHLLYYSQHVGVNTQGIFQKPGTTASILHLLFILPSSCLFSKTPITVFRDALSVYYSAQTYQCTKTVTSKRRSGLLCISERACVP